jgi:hypothetical protein
MWSVVFSGYTNFLHQETDCHDIAEILLKVALSTINQIKSNHYSCLKCIVPKQCNKYVDIILVYMTRFMLLGSLVYILLDSLVYMLLGSLVYMLLGSLVYLLLGSLVYLLLGSLVYMLLGSLVRACTPKSLRACKPKSLRACTPKSLRACTPKSLSRMDGQSRLSLPSPEQDFQNWLVFKYIMPIFWLFCLCPLVLLFSKTFKLFGFERT